jgi:hypothetical protein
MSPGVGEDARFVREMREGYTAFLKKRQLEPSPQSAHQFALAARHTGVSFHRSVAEIVIQLEGVLPAYWSAP